MSSRLDKLLREVLEQEDRAKLVGHLIESLDPEVDKRVEEAWAQEIIRRAAEIDSGAVKTIPWDVVRKRLGRETGG